MTDFHSMFFFLCYIEWISFLVEFLWCTFFVGMPVSSMHDVISKHIMVSQSQGLKLPVGYFRIFFFWEGGDFVTSHGLKSQSRWLMMLQGFFPGLE